MTAGYLTHEHQYEYQVSATNSGGESARSNVASATARYPLPAAPSGLTATAGDGQAVLSWTASPTEGAWYWVYQRDVTAGEASFTQLQLPVTQCCTMTAGYLTNGHSYEFKVTAFGQGGESGASNVVTVTPTAPLPAAPTGLSATAQSDGTIKLSWTASPTADVWYWVYQRDVTAGEASFTQLPLPVTQCCTMTAGYLTHDHQYEYQVSATNSGGESARSNVASATARYPLPAAPSGLTATAGDGQAVLSWTASPTEGAWYWVYQRDVTAGEASFTQLQLPVTQCCTMTAGYLTNGHSYEFKVTAFGQGGESGASNVVTVTPTAPLPAAPTGLSATAQSDGTIKLSWTASPTADVWYWVYQRDVTAGEASFTQLQLPVTQCCTMTAGYLTNGHSYEFKVTAFGQGGESGASNVVTVTPTAPLPAAPSGLTATAGDGQAVLSWTASPTEGAWYWVYQRDVTAGEASFTKLQLPVTQCCTMTAGYLINGHAYEFKVSALSQGGESGASNVVTVTPTAPLPAAPTGLSATAQSDGTIKLSWTAPAPNLWYVVYYRDATAGQAWQKTSLPITICCTFTAGSLTHNHTYQYKVAALLSGGGEGPASGVAQATARFARPAAPTNLRGASNGAGSINLYWDAPGPNLYYWVYMRDVSAGEMSFTRSANPTDQTQASPDWLRHGHTYEFKVTAESPGGEGPASSAIRVISYGGLPAAPSGLTATPGDGRVTLRWTASSTPNVWYVVYQQDTTTGQAWQRLPLAMTTCCAFTAGLLVNGHTYAFKVIATNAGGDSGPTNVVTAKPMPPFPAAPSGLTASPGDGKVTLRWTASSTPNVWYWIEYAPRGGTWQRLKYPVASCCAFTVGYLVNGTIYDFRVRATNAAGDSAASNTASARPMPPMPQPPWNLNATAGDNEAHLTWSPSPTPRVLYNIYMRQATNNGPWLKLPYPILSTAMTAGFLRYGYTYQFKVTAMNLTGESAASNTATVLIVPEI